MTECREWAIIRGMDKTLSILSFAALSVSCSFGAITVIKDGSVTVPLDFKFNGWGLKFAACFDNLINRGLQSAGVFTHELENHLNFVLEGGSIESDGNGTIMTTSNCLLSPNRNGEMTKDEIERYLKLTFGARQVLWVDHGDLEGDDTDSHNTCSPPPSQSPPPRPRQPLSPFPATSHYLFYITFSTICQDFFNIFLNRRG